jgi:putative ABC transport system permease protein
MILNTLKSSYRYITNSKVFTIINLIGLISGLAASFILLLFALNEMSFDSYHKGSDRIYRVLNKDKKGNRTVLTPYSLAPSLLKDTVNVYNSGRLVYLKYITGPVRVQSGGSYFDEPSFVCVDSSILNILTFNILMGSASNCLNSSDGILLSQSAATRYFGDEDPIGKDLIINTMGLVYSLKVCAVYKNLPWNSTMKIDFIAGIPLFIKILKTYYEDPEVILNLPNDLTVETYVKLKPTSNFSDFQRKVPVSIKSRGYNRANISLVFQKITDIYLNSNDIAAELHRRGNKSSLYVYAFLALFILLLAGVNYSILSIARSTLRFKEVGVRKVMGARKAALKSQLLTESVLMAFLAFPASFLIIGFIEPFFNQLYDYQISLYSLSLFLYIPLFAAITVFVGMISGIYIAFYLSSLDAWSALRNQIVTHGQIKAGSIFTTFQLFITISLLITVLTVFLQVNYAKNNKNSITNTDLVMLRFNKSEFKRSTLLKEKLLHDPKILSVSCTNLFIPDPVKITVKIKVFNSERLLDVEFVTVDKDYFKTIGAKIIHGRNFTSEDEQFGKNKIIINQEAFDSFRLKYPIEDDYFFGYNIVGIVSNFNFHSIHSKITPTIFICDTTSVTTMIIQYTQGAEQMVIRDIKRSWQKIAPTVPLDYRFYNDELNIVYQKERIFGQVVSSFALLAFIIMGVGLFGLALLISERKAKEIAIRKVFGATSSTILVGMQRDFLLYVVIAGILAVPVSWYAMSRWLNTFYYKIHLSWWIFAVAILSVAIFVGVIIFVRSYKVLKENPVNALKYE